MVKNDFKGRPLGNRPREFRRSSAGRLMLVDSVSAFDPVLNNRFVKQCANCFGDGQAQVRKFYVSLYF
jgi:hypothetical protein